ncbi:deoxyuridine 5'-triphosphate nucleotidohydrolase [Aerococcus viridans]|uniref:Deoxyuridine 5'-triphosphate nucleotidohydrolase n=1 Tax=Aerococcus viridans TaxID=1377 RepID=A0A2J9PQ19_9LACT|nr:deoxyuridine 5'-triphosphate nucleotidohydrolase [Aerococcus viridans]
MYFSDGSCQIKVGYFGASYLQFVIHGSNMLRVEKGKRKEQPCQK